MRKLTSEEFFEKVDVLYDDESDTMVIKHKGNMVWEIEGCVVNYAGGDVINHTDVENNKKFFYNTGVYDPSLDVEGNVSLAKNAYEESMQEFYRVMEQMQDSTVDIH